MNRIENDPAAGRLSEHDRWQERAIIVQQPTKLLRRARDENNRQQRTFATGLLHRESDLSRRELIGKDHERSTLARRPLERCEAATDVLGLVFSG